MATRHRGGVTTESSAEYFPQWSPDGKWLAFSSNREESRFHLWRMPASGGPPQPLTDGPTYFYRWSPDGKQIYFPGQLRGSEDLWVKTLEGRIS